MRIEGTKVTLRPLTDKDAKPLAKAANNKKIYDNLRDMFPHPYDLDKAKWFIEFARSQPDTHRFVIEFEGKFAGMIGLHPQPDIYRKSVEIGYWVGEEFWGKGLGTEAVKLITEFGFKNLDINRIWAGVFEYNDASKHVLAKNGYEHEGVLKKAVFKNGKFWDEYRMAIVR